MKKENNIKSVQFNVKVIGRFVDYIIHLDFNNVSHDIVINKVNKLI